MANDIQSGFHLDPRQSGIRPGGQKNRFMQETLPPEQQKNHENVRMSGLTWAAQNAAQQAANAQQLQQNNLQSQNGKLTANVGAEGSSKGFELSSLAMEDSVALTTTVSVRSDAVKAPTLFQRTGLSTRFPLFNPAVLEENYKAAYKNTRSHNLLMERFFSHIKMAGLHTLLSAMGVPPEEFRRIQREVKDEALKEIHAKLENDWAYSKALLDILGG